MADEWAAAVKAAVPGHAEVVDALIGWIAHAFQLESRPDPSHSADGSSTVAEGGASGLTGPTGPIYPPPPIGALLVGPTGVGKTALASALLETSPVTAIFLEAEAAYRYESPTKYIDSVFSRAASSSTPVLIVVDQLDALCPASASTEYGGSAVEITLVSAVTRWLDTLRSPNPPSSVDGVTAEKLPEDRASALSAGEEMAMSAAVDEGEVGDEGCANKSAMTGLPKRVFVLATSARPHAVHPNVLRMDRLGLTLQMPVPTIANRRAILAKLIPRTPPPQLPSSSPPPSQVDSASTLLPSSSLDPPSAATKAPTGASGATAADVGTAEKDAAASGGLGSGEVDSEWEALVDELALETPGFCAADLQSLCQDAAVRAVRAHDRTARTAPTSASTIPSPLGTTPLVASASNGPASTAAVAVGAEVTDYDGSTPAATQSVVENDGSDNSQEAVKVNSNEGPVVRPPREHYMAAADAAHPAHLNDLPRSLLRPLGFADLAGLDGIIAELKLLAELCFQRRGECDALGVAPPRGVLLSGPPGVGKTSLALAIAGACHVNALPVLASSIRAKVVGQAEAALSTLFEKARQCQPCVLVIDQLEALAARGDAEGQGSSQDRILACLASQIDRCVDSGAEIMIVGTCGNLEHIDPSVYRPGRLDSLFQVPLPSASARRSILTHRLSRMPAAAHLVESDVVDAVVRATEGASGADIDNICREAALVGLRKNIHLDRLDPTHLLDGLAACGRLYPSASLDDASSPLAPEVDKTADDQTVAEIERQRRSTVALAEGGAEVIGLEEIADSTGLGVVGEAENGRVPCVYGQACYRRDLKHTKQYLHGDSRDTLLNS